MSLAAGRSPAPRRRPAHPIPAGTLEVSPPLRVPGLERERRVRVWLPRGYRGRGEETAHRREGAAASAPLHPLVLLFDGQNVFDDHGSFAGGWHAHRAVDRLATRKVLAPVLVAIDHGDEHRVRELSPYTTRFGEGQLERLVHWIADSLLPIVRGKYAVERAPRRVVVGGSSMGGLAALYAHLRRPDAFGAAIALSPALWVGGGALFDFVRAQRVPWATRVYLDAGAREGGMAEAARSMASLLGQQGWHPSAVRFREDPFGGHSERSWRRRFPRALRFVLDCERAPRGARTRY